MSIYNAHRGMLPQHQGPSTRLTELLEQIRIEFETQRSQAGQDVHARENEINAQTQELDHVRRKVYELEQAFHIMKGEYDRKVQDLQRELDSVRGTGPVPPPPHGALQHNGGPPPPAPPTIGHGPRDLFGGIMAGNGAGVPSMPSAPPPMPETAQGMPPQLTQAAGIATAQPGAGHPPYASYNPGSANGFNNVNLPPTASPGPGKRPIPRGLPGAATPQPNPAMPFPGSPRAHMATPPIANRQPPPPGPSQQQQQQQQQQLQQQQQASIPEVGNALGELDVNTLPPQYKRIGDDWWAIYNPRVERRLEVDLIHTLPHKSVVCCVRFSHDGRFVATGCNRAAQIFDTETGQCVAHLEDEEAEKEGDLYIRSVCFSPDGRYLATGAEDKIIRVWELATRTIRMRLPGHEQDIYSLDFSFDGKMLASGSGDKTVRLWSLDTESEHMKMVIEDGVTTVALSKDGRLVAAGSLDRSVRVWDTQDGMKLDLLDGDQGHQDSVYSVAFSPNGHELVSGSLDRTIKMWQFSSPPNQRGQQPPLGAQPFPKGTGKCIRTFEGHMDFVLSVALTPDGRWVLSGSKDRGVQFWSPHTGEAYLHLQGHRNSVISVAPSPQGKMFATGSGDTKARIWKYEDRGPAPGR